MANLSIYILSFIMLTSAVAHIVAPEFYKAMIPSFIPFLVANILAALAEGAIGILLLIPKYRHIGGLGFMLLMMAFLPVHMWDLVRENPAIGPPPAPAIRLAFQFALIYVGWRIFKKFLMAKSKIDI
ncbi:hypothetical protein [Aureibacter tunicatorum]|uniref:Membrane protein n=1 Tax=Aureibacter tunicatorum TaxID=866807 RepID=A0AAE3XIN5_9BACT|nr:hypothetical protein [Aureibacter tunicatorum]MDR6237527.1 putative membrane protein [Aureibacter tunicatorum]BDD02561.1 hypothetical protein AUTU_00440 [Aureibacter tunicatorum]